MFVLAQAAAATATTPVPKGVTLAIVPEHVVALKKLMMFQFDLSPTQWVSLAEYYGTRVALLFVLLTLAWTLAGWASSFVKTSLRRLRFDETLTLFLAKLTWWGIILLAALACLSRFGVETASFAAILGATGFAIGLAFQGTLSNFAAGAMLLIFRPYKVGDTVNVAGLMGKVDEIELFTTTIDTSDNRRIIVPNSSIFGAVIENVTFHKKRRVDVAVGVSYAADIDETRRVLTEAANAAEGAYTEPEPSIVLVGLGASSVDWTVQVWAPTSEFGSVKQSLIRAVKMNLDAAGLEIPFPQMDLYVKQVAGAKTHLDSRSFRAA
jgi:small conductance mechanosensitive channel